MKFLLIRCALLYSAMVANPQAAQVRVIEAILTGASGVNVGEVLYDVEFVDADCGDVYSGCDELSDFPFSPIIERTASLALQEQVLIDSENGQFGSNPGLILGCRLEYGNYCVVATPSQLFTYNDVWDGTPVSWQEWTSFGALVPSLGREEWRGPDSYEPAAVGVVGSFDHHPWPFAMWRRSPVTVGEPASAWLLVMV